MIKKLLLVLFIITSFSYSQNTVGTVSVTSEAYDAFTLFTVHEKTFLINNCGQIINEWSSNYLPGSSVYLLPNGNLLRPGRLEDGSTDIVIGGAGGIVELYDWDNNLLWSYTYSTDNVRQHHDVYPLPNGNILILAISVMSEADAIQAGRNPSNIQDGEIYSETILELEPVGTNQANIVWEWDIKDHLIQDFDNTKDNFGDVATSPQLLDINFLNDNSPVNNWLHFNSIQYDELRDQIVISSRKLSEIYIIDHSTTTSEAASNSGGLYGKGGDLLYRWGNPIAYRNGTTDDRKLFGQHTPYFIPTGFPNENKIMLFNNGINRTPAFSQVDILSLPETSLGVYDYTPNTAYLPQNTDFTYDEMVSGESSEFFSGIVSNAQQLENDNILVCEGREGYFFELNNANEKVWEYIVPINSNTGASTTQGNTPPTTNLTFRAIKYPLDYDGFIGRDLTPNGTVELNPDLTPCSSLSINDYKDIALRIYPNPSNGVFNITTHASIQSISVYNALGKEIYKTTLNTIDLTQMPDGIYYLRITSNNQTISKKIIKH
ncbi:aryl-sulfate sulfotransferase [uncultured Winogradskyella sp.]|uniref:aryl-sulfate sulfotransferase n=1 Tax=uncultured Winogradskyella sp. TaxID=395353 RepID=UPI002606B2CB|nr:aryl-sulfate sulfotransferase [uncultured Winogradskyella sp.]